MDLKEIEFDDVDRIYLSQGREQWRALVITIMNFDVL
jgi:hypothetical protein